MGLGGGRKNNRERQAAYSLLELLLAMGLVLVLWALSMGVIRAMAERSELPEATRAIAQILEYGRSHAMSQRTYVYVGFAEVNASNPRDQNPQEPGRGRIVVYMLGSRSGTRGYDFNDPEASWRANYGEGANLQMLLAPRSFDNLHLAASLGPTAKEGPMGSSAGRQNVSAYYRIGHPSCHSVTPLPYPQAAPLEPAQCQYFFQKVLYFDPQGTARIQYRTNGDEIKQWMEIGLQATHGPLVSDKSEDQAAIQIDCLTGAVRIFRP